MEWKEEAHYNKVRRRICKNLCKKRMHLTEEGVSQVGGRKGGRNGIFDVIETQIC